MKKILDPQEPFLHKWNKVFLLLCLLAVYLDALFLYIPVISNGKKCLGRDKQLEVIAIVLRSFTDVFHIIHIVFQFRTGLIAPSSQANEGGGLVKDGWPIAKRYLSSYFLFDIFAVLPLPQVVILAAIPYMGGSTSLNTTNLLKYVEFFQYFPRLLRIYPLYNDVLIESGILTGTAWAGAALNLFLYMLASHVIGAFWYVLSIERETICWSQACGNQTNNQTQCVNSWGFCNDNIGFKVFLNDSCPVETPNPKLFDFGIFTDSLHSGVVESTNFSKKSSYCFWWGLQNLSSLGQNLKTSTDQQEIYFAVFISISGLVLFTFLIGNMQTFLQSTERRLKEARVKRREVEQWMSNCVLPEDLRKRVRRYQQYKWKETKGVDEETIICNLPKDLRRDIKRHRCLGLLRRVPMFEKMNEQLLDTLCDCLKPILYPEDSYIVREGYPVDEMLFPARGKLWTVAVNHRTVQAGEFYGEELLTWALDPHCSAYNLPLSTRTVQALSQVEGFVARADDLKFVTSQFRRLHIEQLRHTIRFYSHPWRTWAACFIQAAWRQHCRKKLEKSLCKEEDRLQQVLASREGGSSLNLGASIYALRAVQRSSAPRTRVPERIPLTLQKPADPAFYSET